MNLKTQLQDFFSRSPKHKFNGNGLILPKKDPLDFKVHVSLCIFRAIQNHVLDSLIKLMCVEKPKVTVSNAMGDALIDRARSREASDFLHYTDADVLFCADDDISFDVSDAVKICRKANELKGIVAATCVIKREEGNWIASKPIDEKPIIFSKDAELTEVRFVGAGMVAIHRNVFLDLIQDGSRLIYRCEKLPDGTFQPIEEPMPELPMCHSTDLRFYPFFQPFWEKVGENDFIYLSEDWAFCSRLRKSGYKIWLDPSTLSVVHHGYYGYTITDLLRQPRPKWEQVKSIKYEDVPGKLVISKDDGIRIKPIFNSAEAEIDRTRKGEGE